MLAQITEWHKRARPEPDQRAFDVQLGCHLEEVVEMLATLYGDRSPRLIEAIDALSIFADALKSGEETAEVANRVDLLDALADQVVTLAGVAHCAGMALPEAVRRVNESNWSKFDENGQPIFSKQGKIAKGPRYQEPNLAGLY